MADTCFIHGGPIAAGDGVDVLISVRDTATGATSREARVCCQACAAKINARGDAIFTDVPALTGVVAVYEDGTTERRERSEA